MTENIRFVVAAYVVTWTFLIVYGVRLHLVARRARAEYARVLREGGEEPT